MNAPLEERIPLSHPWSPARYLTRLMFIVTGSLICGFALPSLIAAWTGVFSMHGMENRVGDVHPDVRVTFDQFKRHQLELKDSIKRTDNLLRDTPARGSQDIVSGLLNLRAAYKDELAKAVPPVSIQPFYQHIVMYFWPVMYTCLGVLIFILNPGPGYALPSSKTISTIGIACGIFIMNVWPLWVRVFALRSPRHGRVVYAYSNPDIDRFSFIMQQANFLLFSFLLAWVWRQWLDVYVQRRPSVKLPSSGSNLEAVFDRHNLDSLSHSLVHCQASLSVLSIGFMLYTAVFWNQIIRRGDLRFLFEAVTVHVLWAITVLLTAVPFLTAWRMWRSLKQQAVWELIRPGAPACADLDARLAALRDLQPIGSWNVAASGLTILSSFLIPIIQALIKK